MSLAPQPSELVETHIQQFRFEQQQFELDKRLHALEFDKQQFELAKKAYEQDKAQFQIEQQEICAQLNHARQQFEITQQKTVMQDAKRQEEFTAHQIKLDQQFQHIHSYLQTHLQPYSVPQLEFTDFNGQEVKEEEEEEQQQEQSSLASYFQPDPSWPLSQSFISSTLQDAIKKCDDRVSETVDHYEHLTKDLRVAFKQLRKKEQRLDQRDAKCQEMLKEQDAKSRQLLRKLGQARQRFMFSRYIIKKQHVAVVFALKTNVALRNEITALQAINSALQQENSQLITAEQKLRDDLAKSLSPYSLKCNDSTTSLLQRQLVFNKNAWKIKNELRDLAHSEVIKKHQADGTQEGFDPSKQEEAEVCVMWSFDCDNFKKNVHIWSPRSSCGSLLSDLYDTHSTTPSLFAHFFKKDYDAGTIPKLTNDLKLFFSSAHIGNGRWIQFHGPGKEVDGSDDGVSVITLFSLLNPQDSGEHTSVSNEDRCDLGTAECFNQHKPTDYNYHYYHSSPSDLYTAEYQISIKWE